MKLTKPRRKITVTFGTTPSWRERMLEIICCIVALTTIKEYETGHEMSRVSKNCHNFVQ
jgi:hypothetical protein